MVSFMDLLSCGPVDVTVENRGMKEDTKLLVVLVDCIDCLTLRVRGPDRRSEFRTPMLDRWAGL